MSAPMLETALGDILCLAAREGGLDRHRVAALDTIRAYGDAREANGLNRAARICGEPMKVVVYNDDGDGRPNVFNTLFHLRNVFRAMADELRALRGASAVVNTQEGEKGKR